MERYKEYTRERNNGKRYFVSVINPTIPEDINDTYIIAKSGDMLDVLAYKYYGDSRYWVVIAQANNIGKGSRVIPRDMQIRIPASPNYFFNNIK